MPEMYAPLTTEEIEAAPQQEAKPNKRPICPVPDDAPPIVRVALEPGVVDPCATDPPAFVDLGDTDVFSSLVTSMTLTVPLVSTSQQAA